MLKAGAIAITVIALTTGQHAIADILQLSDDTTIVVSADESWEEQEENIQHFRGNFTIRTTNWAVSADQAIVYGRLDNPERVVADGSPVRFIFENAHSGSHSLTEAEGEHLEYEKDLGILRLSGNAKITDDTRLMQSSEIEYDLEQQKLQVAGPEGVHITVAPGSSEKL